MIGWIFALVAVVALLRERSHHRGVCLGRDLALERARQEAGILAHEWTTRGLRDGDHEAVLVGEGATRVRNRLSEVIAEQNPTCPR